MHTETLPDISVIMPVFNSAPTLERALRSLLEQTFGCWELLAIDHGSTDDSYDRLSRAAAVDPRIRPLRLTANRGPAAARDHALRQVRGATVTYLDSGDEYYPDFLNQVNTWRDGADVLVFGYDPADERRAEAGLAGMQIWSPGEVPARLPWQSMVTPLGLAHRRKLLHEAGLLNEELHFEGDSDLWTHFAAAGATFLFVPQKSGRCRSISFAGRTPASLNPAAEAPGEYPVNAASFRSTYQPQTTGQPSASQAPVWSIGLHAGPSPLDLAPPLGVSNPVLTAADVTDMRAEFVADPFLAFAGGRWYMFFEIMPYGSDIGVIGLAESADCLRWEYRRVVLREPFHLSYPHVFQWRGNYYMVPETLAAGCVRLYRADAFPDRWEHVADLISGQHADPSVFRAGDAWWMFTCPTPILHQTLRLFRAADLAGSWEEHPQSPIVACDPGIARPAGRVIAWDNGWLRFTQDCSVSYGLQVWAFRINTLTPTDYAEELARPTPILSPALGGWNARGMHHLDAHPMPGGGWMAAVDGYC